MKIYILIELYKQFSKEVDKDNRLNKEWCSKMYKKKGEQWDYLSKNKDLETFMEWLENTKEIKNL